MTKKRLGEHPIYGDKVAVIFATDDGNVRVALVGGGREIQSWPIAQHHGEAPPPGRCPVCGATWSSATPCTRAEFLASRVDDAPHPRDPLPVDVTPRDGGES